MELELPSEVWLRIVRFLDFVSLWRSQRVSPTFREWCRFVLVKDHQVAISFRMNSGFFEPIKLENCDLFVETEKDAIVHCELVVDPSIKLWELIHFVKFLIPSVNLFWWWAYYVVGNNRFQRSISFPSELTFSDVLKNLEVLGETKTKLAILWKSGINQGIKNGRYCEVPYTLEPEKIKLSIVKSLEGFVNGVVEVGKDLKFLKIGKRYFVLRWHNKIY
jgi:hypothetical protein